MNLSAAKQFLERQTDAGCSENIAFRCEASKRLEDSGDYAGACEVLGARWRGPGVRPDLNGLTTREAALLMLRAGMLSHRLAVTEARPGAQDEAKNLLSEAARMFASIKDAARQAEALVGMGLCCWRETALDEARILLKEALALAGESHKEQEAAALLGLACVAWSAAEDRLALSLLNECGPLIGGLDSHRLKAGFHSTRALVRRRMGHLDAALVEDTAASYHLEKAGDIRQCAALENNVGYLLAEARRFEEAHEHYDRAWKLFARLRDAVNAGRVDDSRAQALLAERRYPESETFGRRAVDALETSDEKGALVEALLTLATAQARQGKGPEAWASFTRASEIAHHFISSVAAANISEVMRDELGPLLYTGEGVTYSAAYRRLQRALIKRALVDSDWNITKAAFNLGMRQQGLSQLLKNTHSDILDEKPFH